MQIPEGYILVPVWAIKMLEYEGYLERYFYNLQGDATQLEAYHKTESEFKSYFLINRYKNFASFREQTYKNRRKKLKNAKKNTTPNN